MAGGGLDALFADAAEAIANAALRLDGGSKARLAAMAGRTAQIESTAPRQVWALTVKEAGIEVVAGLADSPDVVAKGSPQELLARFFSPDSQAGQRVQIEGDAALLDELAALFRALAPQSRTPPVSSADVVGTAELAAAVLGSAAEGIAGAWREATRDRFADRSQTSDFKERLDRLQSEIEGLARRVQALETKNDAGQPQEGPE